MHTHYAGWGLPEPTRKQILGMLPPLHPEVRCEHVTLQTVPAWARIPPPAEIIVRGMYYDDHCEALVVQVNGIVTRPSDGLLFHLTMSHVAGFESRLIGERLLQFASSVSQIDPWPILGTVPFVRPIVQGRA